MAKYYWTCFGFEKIDPAKMHCTHKFLGELDFNDLCWVKNIVDDYFSMRKPPKPKTIIFSEPEYFGKDNDILVLLPKERPPLLSWLRVQLDQFRDDDFYPYKPHISVDSDWDLNKALGADFTHYYLCEGDGNILMQWKFHEN